MKFIHVADMHLDQSFEGLGKLPNELLERLVKQNQLMVKQLVDVAISESVDVVLIVGDTFHQPTVTIQTQHMLIKELERLAEAGIPVVLTFGNHDYYLPEKYWFTFPQNVTVITSAEVETVVLTTKAQQRVAISGFSYEERWLNQSKLPEFPQRDPAVAFHLGLYHGEVGQSNSTGQQYAPFSLGEMKSKAYDYWALGHIHQPTVLSQKPPVVYSGSPLGHTKKEKNSQGFIIGDLASETSAFEWYSLEQISWLELTISVTEVATIKELLVKLEQEVAALVKQTEEISLVCLILEGANPSIETALQAELANGGLLVHLQERLYEDGDQQAWLFGIKRYFPAEDIALPLGVSQALLTQLSNRYLTEAGFAELAQELYRQKELVRLLGNTPEQREASVAASLTLLQQELGINEGLR